MVIIPNKQQRKNKLSPKNHDFPLLYCLGILVVLSSLDRVKKRFLAEIIEQNHETLRKEVRDTYLWSNDRERAAVACFSVHASTITLESDCSLR